MPAVSRERPHWEKVSNKDHDGSNRANHWQNGYSKQQDQEESLVKIGEDWIKIGDEYYQNPLSITMIGTLKQVVKEVVLPDPVEDRFDQKNRVGKRKRDNFEAENMSYAFIKRDEFEEAAPNMSYAIINNRSTISQENYVKLDIINERFMSSFVDLEEKEDKVYRLPYGFKTKRRYLYDI